MRITIIGLNYAPEVTGIAPYTTGLAEGLADRGHRVTVITGYPHYPQWRIRPDYEHVQPGLEMVDGVRLIRVRHYVPAYPSMRRRTLMETSFAQAAVRAPWDEPDVVVTVSPALLAAAAVVQVARARRVPVGVIVQDIYSTGVVETGTLGGRGARMVARLETGTLAQATGVAVIHKKFEQVLSDIGAKPRSVSVIRNWTHLRGVEPQFDRESVRRRHGWAPDETVVLHAGNMGVKQGLQNVITAARLSSSMNGTPTRQRIKFVLLGDGSQRVGLEAMAQGVANVQMIGTLPDEDFRDALAAADLLLVNELPGVSDMAVPSKLTSYLMSKRPIIAATERTSGTAGEIHASGNGVVVAPGDPEALVSSIRNVSEDRATAEAMALAGEHFARSTLDRDAAIDRYAEWCGALCKDRALR